MVEEAFKSQPRVVQSATEAAEISIRLAEQAAASGTFGVGGLMLGPRGEILFTAQNAVIQNGKVSRPNAHVEWQLVDAYFQARGKGAKLPAPQECTIVSQLDPCCMCAGAILKGGFNALTIAMDDYAGVSFKAHGKFDALPANLKPQAEKSFGYLGSEGNRPYIGPGHVPFAGQAIAPDLEKRAFAAFVGSMDLIRDYISRSEGMPFNRLRNPRELGSGNSLPFQKNLRKYDRGFLGHSIKNNTPGVEMASVLIDAARTGKHLGNDFNAASLIDPFGNVLLTMHGKEGVNPARTPLVELMEAYTAVRAKALPREHPYLPHPKYCTLVTLFGPGNDARSIMEIGVYGSTMEREVPARAHGEPWQYVVPCQSQRDLNAMLAAMPPLYSAVIKIKPQQVQDAALIRACQNAVEVQKNRVIRQSNQKLERPNPTDSANFQAQPARQAARS
jgi:cytosine deaminase